MPDYINMDNLGFFINDVENLEEILSYERYADYDSQSVSILLQSMKDWADRSFYPYFRVMDEEPVQYRDGKVIAHDQVGTCMREGGKNGYIGACFDYDHLGSQMPKIVYAACSHILQCANNHLPGYLNLTGGAANLIIAFGSAALIERFVPPMMEGRWGGTMALTEPQAGSSLSDIISTAEPAGDGSYLIKGQKIFISGGDHQGCENFVHLTLVRIKGAPEGTKGISLFAIPKFRPTADGNLEFNDVTTAGDFQKLGQRGYSTVHLVFGEKDDCRGWLVGEEEKGLAYMFQMMNGARIDVGLTAASVAVAAYYASLQYARERPQGRLLNDDGSKDPAQPQTLIINHPDVRRMLLYQKAITEGALALIFYCTALEDRIINDDNPGENHLLLEILTPIAKTFPSEKGKDSVDQGLQVLGGYGYCLDFPLQQYYRDIRIMSIYEGTTGIQSLDLLGRKVLMQNGAAFELLLNKIMADINKALEDQGLADYASALRESTGCLEAVIRHLGGFIKTGKFNSYLADATIFMDLMSTIVIAWQWLRIGLKVRSLEQADSRKYSSGFLESKLHSLSFFYKYELTRCGSLKDIIISGPDLTTGDINHLIN